MHLNEVLKSKGDNVFTVTPDITVRDLIALLAEHNIGAAVVCTADKPIVGIVSERDIVRGLVHGTELLDAPISEIMTAEVRSAKPTDTVHDLMLLMTEHRIRHVPVVVDGELHGIVSIGDVVKSRIGELEFERDQLESYVTHAQ
ncbi:MAG: CBS domain-containing protein [Propionibacteriales bacterium]|nr:CBS domain-containing protein [Propionibacteriales bacterium]